MTPGGGRRLGLPKCRHAGIQRGTDSHRTRSRHCLTNVGDAGVSEGFTPGGEVKRREPIKQPINQKPCRLRQRRLPPVGMPLPLKGKQIHHRDRTLHCPNRNLRLGAQQEQIPSFTQDPDNAQSQRGTGKTLDPPQGQDPTLPEQEPGTWGPAGGDTLPYAGP